MRLLLTPGQAAEITSAPALLAGVRAKGAIADRAYDANPLRALLAAAGMEAVTPSKRNRKVPIAHDAVRYKERNRISNAASTSSSTSGTSPPASTDATSTS